jgi:hypothetical protein
MAPRSRSAVLSPATLPAGAMHRGDGRGVDADAGQGNVLRGSNHRTPGCLSVSTKQESTQIQSTIEQKATVTYVTLSDVYRRQPSARQSHVLAWRALTANPVNSSLTLASAPRPFPAPEDSRSALKALQVRTLHATYGGCNLTLCSFMPGSSARRPQSRPKKRRLARTSR